MEFYEPLISFAGRKQKDVFLRSLALPSKMGVTLLSVPAPTFQHTPLFQCSYFAPLNFHNSISSLSFSSSRRISFLSSTSSSASSSASSAVEEETNPCPSPQNDLPLLSQSDPYDSSSFRGCKACGKEEIEKGCNGEGRIQGGIATFPGFGWWPIKAYRPCPGFIASGGRYKRQGQSMDEVASGGGGRRDSSARKNQSSKK